MHTQKAEEKYSKFIEQENLKYALDDENKIANIIGCNSQKSFIIPCYIIHNMQKYIVISICDDSFKNIREIKSIQFDPDSQLQIIGETVFSRTSIENISIPASVVQISDGAFYNCKKLRTISFSSDSKLQIIEKQAFSGSSIESISIPASVTQICKSAFYNCKKLKKIEIQPDSKLQKIEKFTFFGSSIETISIPASVTHICESAFSDCQKLRKIEIPPDSKLQIIEKEAFSYTLIEDILIPENVVDLEEGWCSNVPHLVNINVMENNPFFKLYDDKFIIKKSSIDKENYDILVFSKRDIEKAIIPRFIEIIESYSFIDCIHLHQLEIPSNSKLQIIKKFSFYHTSINGITVPSDSKLQIIEKCAFCHLPIQSISIQSNLSNIEEDAFGDCQNLIIIQIDNYPDLIYKYNNIFSRSLQSNKVILMCPFSLVS